MKYNKRHNTTGQLFLNRHKRIYLNPERRLYYMLCYIHHNPIHHKFRKNYSDWKYSSYTKYVNGVQDYLAILNQLGGIDYFLKAHESFRIDKNIDDINIDSEDIEDS
jgi:predicted SprT family Zn-dependent metalloprotease